MKTNSFLESAAAFVSSFKIQVVEFLPKFFVAVLIIFIGIVLAYVIRFLLKRLINKMIALLGDRDFTNHTMHIELLDKPTPIPQGPAFISLKTGAPIVPGFMIREKEGKFLFKLVFEKPIQIQPSQDEAKDVRELTKKYLDVIEKYVKLYPTQWFIFNKFWEPIRCKTAL